MSFTIKKLEWKRKHTIYTYGLGKGVLSARTSLVCYSIYKTARSSYGIIMETSNTTFKVPDYKTIKEAKDAAYADFRKRIMGNLEFYA